VADRTTVDSAYGHALDIFAARLILGLIARNPDYEVWRPLAVASADNDLEGFLGTIPRVIASTGGLDQQGPSARELPNYTVARELAMVCDVAADLGLLVRSGEIARR